MILDLLLWLDAVRFRYWFVAILLFSMLLISAFAPTENTESSSSRARLFFRWLSSRAVFWGLLLLTLLFFRWQIFLYPTMLNADEAQMGAQAMKYFTDIVPWRSVDGTTSGPLNSWILMAPGVWGGNITFASGRIVAAICVWGTLVFTFLTVRQFATETEARVATLAPAVFYILNRDPDLVHYSSEHLPILLLAAAVWAGVRALCTDSDRIRPGALFVSALLIGALPFAKLQAGPIGAVGGLALIVASLIKLRDQRSAWLRTVLVCIAGGLTIPTIILGMVAAGNSLSDFVISYLGLHDAHGRTALPLKKIFPFLFTETAEMSAYLFGASFFWAFAAVILRGTHLLAPLKVRKPLFWYLGYLAVCFLVIVKPGLAYPHYLLFLVHPIALISGLLLSMLTRALAMRLKNKAHNFLATQLAIILFVATFGPAQASSWFRTDSWKFVGRASRFLDFEASSPVRFVRAHSRPGDRLVVYGWNPELYMQTELVQGTRDAISQWCMHPNKHQDYYRRRFLNDLKASKSRFFVDSDIPSPQNLYVQRDDYGHEHFPELAAYIRENYRLAQECVDGSNGGTIQSDSGDAHYVRIYVARD